MFLLKRFSFWLPLLALIHYINELIYNPIKDIVFAIDPLLNFLLTTLNNSGFLYDYENHKILFPGFLFHFCLWLIYGVVIDYFIHVLFKESPETD